MRIFLIGMVLLLSGCGFEVVDTGYRGVETNFGKVVGEPLPEGLHFYNPFTSNIEEINVQEQIFGGDTTCFTKDTQSVKVSYALTYYPDPSKIGDMFKQFGSGWKEKIILPALLGSVKDTIGQYVADDLVGKREISKAAAQKELSESLVKRNVFVTRLDFVNLDFDDAYEKAVEEKVVATQKAMQAKNKTVEVEEQAKQTVMIAKAAAESMRIQSEALKENQNLTKFEAVKKWDGKLPQYVLGNGVTPFVNLKDLQ